MKVQKRNKQKFDISKITRKESSRKMTTPEALKIAIRNNEAMAILIEKWLRENPNDETYVLAQGVEDIYTHLYCETDANYPFPMIFYKLNSNLDGVIKSTLGEIQLIKASVNPSSIQEGLELKILTTRFIQKDRMETFQKAVKSYRIALEAERTIKNGGE